LNVAIIGASAGIGGALLAFIAAFGVQFVAGRQKHKEHLARLGGQFLTHGAMYADALHHAFKSRDQNEALTPAFQTPYYKETIEAATELSLLGGRRVAFQIQVVMGAMSSLTLVTLPDVEREVWVSAMVNFGAERLELQHLLRKELGSGRLSDDDLGHDKPDIEAPTSTHTPWR
jgi:hypothetical protein